jgi:flavorubredoxin
MQPTSCKLCGCQYRLQNGTTYNAYLIFGEKTALVDASHEKFRGLFMRALRQQLTKAGRSLDYVIVSHTEPDHSGAHFALACFSWRPMACTAQCYIAHLRDSCS